MAGFKEKVLLPNLRVQMYSRKTERNITARWYADTFDIAASGTASKAPSRKETETITTRAAAAA